MYNLKTFLLIGFAAASVQSSQLEDGVKKILTLFSNSYPTTDPDTVPPQFTYFVGHLLNFVAVNIQYEVDSYTGVDTEDYIDFDSKDDFETLKEALSISYRSRKEERLRFKVFETLLDVLVNNAADLMEDGYDIAVLLGLGAVPVNEVDLEDQDKYELGEEEEE